MIFRENRLLADDSHEISYRFSKIEKDVANLSSAAVVIGALRVNCVRIGQKFVTRGHRLYSASLMMPNSDPRDAKR